MEILRSRQWELLFAVGARIVPEIAALTAAEREAFRAIVADALGDRPVGMQKQFRAFLAIVNTAPSLRFGATFLHLRPEQQDRFLRWLQDCPVALLRSGFWGMKAMVLMGYYARPEIGPVVGWTPSFRGNEKLHA